MGKLFENEIEYLYRTVNEVMNNDISELVSFFRHTKGNTLITVGSGGSYSVALAIEYLTSTVGYLSKSITPIELKDNIFQIHNSAVLIATAGGRNADTINSYKYISGLEPIDLITLCARKNAPVKRLQRRNIHNYYYELDISFGKDGYLAVNSLIASIVAVARSLFEITSAPFFKVNELEQFSASEDQIRKMDKVLSKETIIVMYAGMAAPIAKDMESKFSETSLGNIQLADYRNIAHGRHYWLADRRKTTSIIMIAGPNEKIIARETLSIIPDDIPVFMLESDDFSINGMLELYMKMFLLVKQAGKLRGINPGKPKVEEFGRKMYHLNYNPSKEFDYEKYKNDRIEMALFRKYGFIQENLKQYYYNKVSKILEQYENKEFRGIIFDYDGTLHDKNEINNSETVLWSLIERLVENGVAVGIATGRGKSVRSEIESKVSIMTLSKIWIAYYNGSTIGLGNNNSIPNNDIAIPEAFYEMRDILIHEYGVDKDSIEIRPYQLTIIENIKSFITKKDVFHVIKDYLGYKAVVSSHSVDIVNESDGKELLIKKWIKEGIIYEQDELICIGDSGDYLGNDYELLNRWNGLSVDCVSDKINACWNFAPMGDRNLEAAEYYLKCLKINKKGCFKVKWGNKKNESRTGRKNIDKHNELG